MTDAEKIQLIKVQREIIIRKARNDFFVFCKVVGPSKLYNDDAIYIRNLCYSLQELYESQTDDKYGLAISMPPRHGKSFTVSLFALWLYGKNSNIQIMYSSYSQDLANKFSQQIRNDIKNYEYHLGAIKFNDIFPGLTIAKDQKRINQWKISQSIKPFSLKTSSFNTPMTGNGCDFFIIDDPHKDANEAMNEKALEERYSQFTNTMLSRIEKQENGQRGRLIVVQTRWSKLDLIGRIKESEIGDKFNYIEIAVESYDEDGELVLLNEKIFDKNQFYEYKANLNDLIFEANYNQKLIDMSTVLYSKYKFYDKLPDDTRIVAVMDPAGDGCDYTTIIVAAWSRKENKAYIIDVFYKNNVFSEIQDQIIDFIIKNKVEDLRVEGNAGFAMLIPLIKKELLLKNYRCKIEKIIQNKKKEIRISVACNAAQEDVLFPKNADKLFREAFNHFINFKSNVLDNINDDFEDAYTMLWEAFVAPNKIGKIGFLDKRSLGL